MSNVVLCACRPCCYGIGTLSISSLLTLSQLPFLILAFSSSSRPLFFTLFLAPFLAISSLSPTLFLPLSFLLNILTLFYYSEPILLVLMGTTDSTVISWSISLPCVSPPFSFLSLSLSLFYLICIINKFHILLKYVHSSINNTYH